MKNITNKTKTILFASLIAAMILPFSGMMMAEAAQSDDKQRVTQKQISIEKNFERFLKLQEQSDTIQVKINSLEEQHDKNNDPELKKLEKQMLVVQKQLEQVQKQSNKLHEIPQVKIDKLLEAMDKIKENFSFRSDEHPDAPLDAMFVDTAKELIVVLENPESTEFSNSANTVATRSAGISAMTPEIKSFVGDEIEIIVTSMRDQSHNSSSNCNYDHERDDYCQPAAGGVEISSGNERDPTDPVVSTLGFPATQNDGTKGFVTVGHALYDRELEPIGSPVYQPDSLNQIGTVKDRYYNGHQDCDCAFIELTNGRTVANQVVYGAGILLTIDDFKDKWQTSDGDIIMMSGKTLGSQFGAINSRYNYNTETVFATYNAIPGDSGGPVGKVSGSVIDIYGIHKGNSWYGNYEAYMPYDVLDSYLDLQ